MIEESLLKSNFVGKDGFVWWIGQVADPSVWRDEKSRVDSTKEEGWAYRCKVRIIGYHPFDLNELPDKDLPWAHVLTSASDGAPGQGSFGKLPMLVGGESVLGFFLDGDEGQQPVVVSCFYRSKSVINATEPGPFKPFTGMKGNLSASATRRKTPSTGTVNQPPQSTTESGPAVTFDSNPQFGVDNTGSLDLSSDFNPLSTDNTNTAGSSRPPGNIPQDELFYDDIADIGFNKAFYDEGKIGGENGCGNNFLSQITEALQGFIGFVNGLESTTLGFIDPIRNKIVDIQQSIKKVARLIASIMKFVINGMRDMIMKLVGKLLRLFITTLPLPQQLPVSEAAKNILNIIFCLFEKLFGPILDFIMGLLSSLLGKTPTIPRCAAEETAGALIAKLADMIDGVLSTVLSGLDWLAGGISQISSSLRGAVNILNQLLSFLDCDSLQCKSTKSWDPFGGVSLPPLDNWANSLASIDVLSGYGDNVNDWIGFLSMFGSGDTPFAECRAEALSPTRQDTLISMPPGTRFYQCIPPEIRISGDGVNATGVAVVSSVDGSILTIKVLNPGSGFTVPPTVSIIDNSNYGQGALAQAKINALGNIESIYITSPGKGYCQTNLNIIGIQTSTLPSLTTTTTLTGVSTILPGISTIPVGIVTNIVVVQPGLGYTNGDIIQIGQCSYNPIVTPNGSIIGVTSSSSCVSKFLSTPSVTINTKKGQGATLYPVLEYTEQYVTDNPQLIAGISTDLIINVVQCITNR
jgi:hypothetical protein